LEEILGLSTKKKNLPDTTEFEGGGL